MKDFIVVIEVLGIIGATAGGITWATISMFSINYTGEPFRKMALVSACLLLIGIVLRAILHF